MNNFKLLEEKVIGERGDKKGIIKDNVQSTIGFFSLLTNIIELYSVQIARFIKSID